MKYCHTFELTAFEPCGIYTYQVTKQNVNRGNLWTEYNEVQDYTTRDHNHDNWSFLNMLSIILSNKDLPGIYFLS